MIELDHVSKSYSLPGDRSRQVLNDVSLQLARGTMTYLVGPTGCGKSTLMELLYMNEMPDEGVVRVGTYRSDQITSKKIPYLRRSLGVVFQDFQLLPDRNVYENVAFTLYATGHHGRRVKQKVLHTLSRVGLSHRRNQYPHELSGGEQQRVSIARAIVNDPWVLLADEPTGNLDPGVAEEIHELMVGLHKQGMTFIMATHDYTLVRKFPAQTLAFMKHKLVEVDPHSL